jgi:cytochrome c oxidase cbb3-type subunit III
MRKRETAARRRVVHSGIMGMVAIAILWGRPNFAAWAQAASQGPTQTPTATVESGRKRFEQSCGFCHGADATGARGPDLVRSSLVAHDVKGDLIGQVIRNGRPDKGMPPMSLADDQIAEIAAFLHDRAKEALESSSVPNAYPVDKLLTGNANAGKAFFEGAGGCKNCHSPTGDLAGIAGKYPPIDLQTRMLYPHGRHTTAVVTLTSGEQIKGKLEHADDFMIGLRDDSGWYRSFPRNRVKVELQDPLAAHRELLGKLTQADMHNLFAYLQTLKKEKQE